MPLKVGTDGTVGFQRMSLFTPSRPNLDPAKRLSRIKELLLDKRPKVCIVRGEGIGDVIMTTPTLTAIQSLFNHNVDITYATNIRYLDGALPKVLQYNPDIIRIIDRDNLDEADYDSVINLHCPAVGYEYRHNPPLNRVDIFARYAGFASLSDTKLKYYLTQQEVMEGRGYLDSLGMHPTIKLAMVNVHSSSPWRGLDITMTKEIITRLFEERRIVSIVPVHASDSHKDIDWTGVKGAIALHNADVRRLASILVHCDLLLCPDSAMLHVACALGVPTVSVFMYTDPKARINYFPNAVAVSEARFPQCHCWKPKDCKLNYACLRLLTADTIVNACMNHLDKTNKIDLSKLQLVNR